MKNVIKIKINPRYVNPTRCHRDFLGKPFKKLEISNGMKEENGLRPFQRETLEAIKNSSAKLIFVEAAVGSGY